MGSQKIMQRSVVLTAQSKNHAVKSMRVCDACNTCNGAPAASSAAGSKRFIRAWSSFTVSLSASTLAPCRPSSSSRNTYLKSRTRAACVRIDGFVGWRRVTFACGDTMIPATFYDTPCQHKFNGEKLIGGRRTRHLQASYTPVERQHQGQARPARPRQRQNLQGRWTAAR